MENKVEGKEDYEDKELTLRLILDLERLRLKYSVKHLRGKLFYKVWILVGKSSEWNILHLYHGENEAVSTVEFAWRVLAAKASTCETRE